MILKSLPSYPHKKKSAYSRSIFNVYLLSDIRFLSSIPNYSNLKFSDSDKLDIETLFNIEIEKLYKKLRSSLEKVVLDEFRDHSRNRTKNWESHYNEKLMVKNKDYFSIEYCYSNLRWNKYYGGKKWGKAAKMLLNHPKSSDEKMFWIDKILDLEHNTGGIFYGKGCGLDCLYKKFPNSLWKIQKSYFHKNILDVRAQIPSCFWANLCDHKLWNIVYKYVKRLYPVYFQNQKLAI